MDISLINSQSLLRLLALTEKKEELLSLVDNIDAAIIATLKGRVSVEIVEVESAPASAAPTQKPVAALKLPAKPAKAKKAKGGKFGGLKEKILALLEAAGDQGLRVKEIAQKLNSKPGNIAVWFSTTGKKLVTKVEPGRYAVKGATKSASKPAAVAPVAVKAVKPAKAKKKSGLTPEGRAKLAANMKARWAARKAGKPAKKGFKLPKKA
jgi:Spy/CpxP family protein refolding chaperone